MVRILGHHQWNSVAAGIPQQHVGDVETDIIHLSRGRLCHGVVRATAGEEAANGVLSHNCRLLMVTGSHALTEVAPFTTSKLIVTACVADPVVSLFANVARTVLKSSAPITPRAGFGEVPSLCAASLAIFTRMLGAHPPDSRSLRLQRSNLPSGNWRPPWKVVRSGRNARRCRSRRGCIRNVIRIRIE